MVSLLITIIFILLFFAINILKKRDLFTPGKIFFMVIMGSYFIYCLNLSMLQKSNSIFFTIVIITLVLIFNIGTKIKFGVKKGKNKIDYSISKNRYKIITYILFILIVISFLATWSILGPPPLLSKVERSTYFVSGFGTIFLLTDILSFLIMYDLFNKKYLKKAGYVMLVINIIMILMITNKTQLFFLICQYLLLYNAFKKKIRFKKLILIPIITVAIFVIYYSFIYEGMYVSNEYVYIAAKMNVPKSFAFITEPYLYVSFNYENLFNYILNKSNTVMGYGYYLFDNISNALNLTQSNLVLDNQWHNILQVKWLTTGTLFKPFYMDFGFVGMYVFTFILGIVCGYSYRHYISDKNNIFYLYFYLMNMISLFFSFFTNNFISINYLFNIFVMYIIYRICYKKKVNQNE